MLKDLFKDVCSPQTLHHDLEVLFAYLFDKIGKYQYRDQIGDKARAKAMWAIAENSGYLLKNCKLFIWANCRAKRTGVAVSPAKFGVLKADVAFLRSIDLPKVKSKYRAYSVAEFDALEGAVLTSSAMKTYIGKFISKKLIFLRSYGQTPDSLSSQLVCAALYALRKHYPSYESELHALNICKTAIHNHGIGLIEYWTRGKRNALLNENGAFQAVHVQYETLGDVSVQPEHEAELRVNLGSLVNIAEGLPDKQQRFLSAAAGIYDPGVSMFIGANNSDVVDTWGYPRYLNHVRTYFGLTVLQQERLLESLRQKMI